MNKILLNSGGYFDFNTPEEQDYNITDIAHALSHTCRFTGHCDKYYSVAQHSVLCSYLVRPEYALEALLHDAQEAYLNDISTPLKNLLPDYREIEAKVEKAIAKQFLLAFPIRQEVKDADRVMIANEFRQLFGKDILPNIESYVKVRPWSAKKSKRKFLERYFEIIELL